MREWQQLENCYIVHIGYAVEKTPLMQYYKHGYWVSWIFGNKCYLVKKRVSKGRMFFTSRMCFCELTKNGRKFIEKYAEKKAKEYKNYLMHKNCQQPWEFCK